MVVDARDPLSERASAFLKADFEQQLRDNPEFAAQIGRHEYRGLQDLSPAAFAQRIKYLESAISKADALRTEAADANLPTLELKLKLIGQSMRCELKSFEMGLHLYPINSIGYGGVHHSFVEALDWLPPGNAGHETFIDRIEHFPAQVDQYIELLRLGIAENKVATRAMVRRVPEQLAEISKQLDDPNSVVRKLAAAVPATMEGRVAAGVDGFRLALANLSAFVINDYTPKTRDSPGCAGLGDTVYAHCLEFHTTTTMKAAEIHSIGLEQVARIEQRYRVDVMTPLGMTGTFQEFVAGVQKPDSGEYYQTADELIAGYTVLTAEITEMLPKYFEALPKSRLEVVPKDSETAPAAYYMQGTADGLRPGKFTVNVSNLGTRPKYEMVALALHEGVPGHHLQGSLTIENPEVPSFLRFVEDRRYEFCPARRQLYAAYLEGWALYCEALGEEMGLYRDPMALFGRLSMEMMRAVRLVVDTGIHAQGWSVEKAIDYMMEKTGMHRHECEAECYRYEAWPGQACAYKIGEIAFHKIRAAAEAELGKRFDLRRFHTEVLAHGPLPLDTLSDLITAWVARERSAPTVAE